MTSRSPRRSHLALILLCFHLAIDEAAKLPAPFGSQCGKSIFGRHRIIAGKDALPGDWPWHVGIHVRGQYYCGGAIINPSWVVTAAHCIFTGIPASDYTVRVGDTDRNTVESHERNYTASLLIANKNWVFPQPDSDIALIKLTEPITFNKFASPVCLPSEDYDVPLTSTCYLSGWGVTTPGSKKRSMLLQQANMPPLSNKECSEKTRGTDDDWLQLAVLTENMICGGIDGSPLSGCNGDSGGPYVCRNTAGQWVLQGVVSWGDSKCNSSLSYSVFTRVSKFIDWITTKVDKY